MPIAFLNRSLTFPDPRQADSEGLAAVGGDLSPARLLQAYRSGFFPWSANPLTWWSPDPRAIIELERFHIPRSLARILRHNPFRVTLDRAFRQVMEGCAAPGPNRPETWITPEFIAAYTRLHELGHAHSVECWLGGDLAGGIYGVAVGGAFSGESMFHRADNASKVALCRLAQLLRERGFALFDIQMLTPATERLSGIEIPREEYLRRLAQAAQLACEFRDAP